MADGSTSPEELTPQQAGQSTESHEVVERVNPLKEVATAFEGVADRVDKKLTERPDDLWLGTDKKYRLPNVERDIQRIEDDIRSNFRDRKTEEYPIWGDDGNVKDHGTWVRSKSGAILDVGENGQVVGIKQAVIATGGFENDDTEFVAHELGSLPANESLEDLKKDPSRWKVELTGDGRPYPGYAVLPTKVEGMSVILHEVDRDINSTRKDVMQMSVQMDNKAIEATRKSPALRPTASVAA